MLPTITKGYLIAKFDYDVFDEILIFLTNQGLILSTFSLGSRRINSKNGRNRFFGNFLEIEYFQKDSNKLQKLKKITTMHFIDESFHNNKTLKIVNILFNKWVLNISENKDIYQLYQESLGLILLNNKHEWIITYVFFKLIKAQFSYDIKNKCGVCNKNNFLRAFNERTLQFECESCYHIDSIIFSNVEIEYIIKKIQSNFFEPKNSEILIEQNIYKKLFKKLLKYNNKIR